MKKGFDLFWSSFLCICHFFLQLIYRLAGTELTDERWHVWQQFIKFILVGCSNTVVLLIFYYIVLFLAGSEYYILGQTMGYVTGIFNSYFWNRRFIFHVKNKPLLSFVKMSICYGLTYVIQVGLLYLQVDMIGMSDIIAPIVAILITTPINFFLSKFFAFYDRAS